MLSSIAVLAERRASDFIVAKQLTNEKIFRYLLSTPNGTTYYSTLVIRGYDVTFVRVRLGGINPPAVFAPPFILSVFL
jgi:hypothetical protein